MGDPGKGTDVSKHSCVTAGCERPVVTRGYCSTCYSRWRKSDSYHMIRTAVPHRLTDIDAEARTGVCSICGPTRVKLRSNKRHYECMIKRREHLPGNPEPRKFRPTSDFKRLDRVWRYGISVEKWHGLLVDQSGLCAICTDQLVAPHVDHDHETGAVRGLLCRACNVALGLFRDNTRSLEAAQRYLMRPPVE